MQTKKLFLLFVPGITQGNWERGISPRFCLFAFVFGITVIKKIRRQCESKIPLLNFNGWKLPSNLLRAIIKLLGRVVLRILWNIHDRVLLRKQPAALRRWSFLQKSSAADVPLDTKTPSNWSGALNVGCR